MASCTGRYHCPDLRSFPPGGLGLDRWANAKREYHKNPTAIIWDRSRQSITRPFKAKCFETIIPAHTELALWIGRDWGKRLYFHPEEKHLAYPIAWRWEVFGEAPERDALNLNRWLFRREIQVVRRHDLE